jgi:gamma-glutamyltranspeptidase/glutathione hydrolase
MRPLLCCRPILAIVAAASYVAAFGAHAQFPGTVNPQGSGIERSAAAGTAAVASRRFMVAAANPHAVEVGYRILRQGGSAVDAAVAVQLVLGLVEPQSSGIGGGAFMLVHDARRHRLMAYDGRETAPAAAKPDRFLDQDGKPLKFFDAFVGGRSVGVPGVVALLAETHKRHGRLPWVQLFRPAIELAERGFAVSPLLHASIAAEGRFPQARASAYFHAADSRPLAAGTVLRNPRFAATLRAIAAGGADAFYRGDIARDIVATVADAPVSAGDMTLADLAAYKVIVREPVCGAYRAYQVCGMPLPSSGGPTVLQMLGMLEPYDLTAMGAASLWSVHFISEAGRLAYADRDMWMADPGYYAAPAGLLDRGYLGERSRLIRTTGSIGRATPGMPPVPATSKKVAYAMHAAPEFPSTSHVSIVDRYGDAVAMSTSIEYAFGSRLMTEGGFLLNNELTDFSFAPEADGMPVANRVEGGKRPRSAMAPTIVYDAGGRVFMVAGSTGGPTIINQVVKTLVAVIDWGLDPQAAVGLPNFGSRNGPTELQRGTRVAELAPKLEALGHDTVLTDGRGGAHVIVRNGSGWAGGADPRREGAVRGD